MDHASHLPRRTVLQGALGAAALSVSGLSVSGIARPAAAQEAGAAPALEGTVTLHDHGDVRIHHYGAPEASVLVHSVIVEGPTSLVLFDAQLLTPYAAELAEYAASLGKPLERVVVSHVHADHWSGLQTVLDRFPGTPVYALQSVRDFIASTGDAVLANRAATPFGPQMAKTAIVPGEVLPVGAQTIDGVLYEFEEFEDAESSHQLVARLPAQATLLAFDLVFSADTHAFVVEPTFDHWVEILQGLRAREFDTLLVGHASAVTRDDIDATIDYVRRAKEVHAASADPAAFAQGLKDAFPERTQPGWADFSGLLLYGVISP